MTLRYCDSFSCTGQSLPIKRDWVIYEVDEKCNICPRCGSQLVPPDKLRSRGVIRKAKPKKPKIYDL